MHLDLFNIPSGWNVSCFLRWFEQLAFNLSWINLGCIYTSKSDSDQIGSRWMRLWNMCLQQQFSNLRICMYFLCLFICWHWPNEWSLYIKFLLSISFPFVSIIIRKSTGVFNNSNNACTLFKFTSFRAYGHRIMSHYNGMEPQLINHSLCFTRVAVQYLFIHVSGHNGIFIGHCSMQYESFCTRYNYSFTHSFFSLSFLSFVTVVANYRG